MSTVILFPHFNARIIQISIMTELVFDVSPVLVTALLHTGLSYLHH